MLYQLNTAQVVVYMVSGGVETVRHWLDQWDNLELKDPGRRTIPIIKHARHLWSPHSPPEGQGVGRESPSRPGGEGREHPFSPDQPLPSAPHEGLDGSTPSPHTTSTGRQPRQPSQDECPRPRRRRAYRRDHKIFVASLHLLFVLLAAVIRFLCWWIYVLVFRSIVPPSNNPAATPMSPNRRDSETMPGEKVSAPSSGIPDHEHYHRALCGRCERVVSMASVLAASGSIASSIGAWISSSSSSALLFDDDDDDASVSLEDTFRGRRVRPRVRIVEGLKAFKLGRRTSHSPAHSVVTKRSSTKPTVTVQRDKVAPKGDGFASLLRHLELVSAYLVLRQELDLLRLEKVELVSAQYILEAIQEANKQESESEDDLDSSALSESDLDEGEAGTTPPTSPDKDEEPVVSIVFEGVTLIGSPRIDKSVKEDTVTVLFDADEEQAKLNNPSLALEAIHNASGDVEPKIDRAVQTNPLDVEAGSRTTRFGSLFEFSRMVYDHESKALGKRVAELCVDSKIGSPGGSLLDLGLAHEKEEERDFGLTPSMASGKVGNSSPPSDHDETPAIKNTYPGGSPVVPCSLERGLPIAPSQSSVFEYPLGSDAPGIGSLLSFSAFSVGNVEDEGHAGALSSTLRTRHQAPRSSHGDSSDDEAEEDPSVVMDSDDESQPRPGVETQELLEAGEMLKRWSLKDSTEPACGQHGPAAEEPEEAAFLDAATEVRLPPEGKQRTHPVQKGKEHIAAIESKVDSSQRDIDMEVVYETMCGIPLSAPPSFEATSSDSIVVDGFFNNLSADKTPKREGKHHLKPDATPFVPITVVPPSPDTFHCHPQPHLPRIPTAPIKRQPAKPMLNPGARTFTPRPSPSQTSFAPLTPPPAVSYAQRAPNPRGVVSIQPPRRQGLPPLPVQQMPPRIPFTPIAGNANLNQPRPLGRCTATKSLPSLSTVPFFSPCTPQNAAIPILPPPGKGPARRGPRRGRTVSAGSSELGEMDESEESLPMSDVGEGPPTIPVIPEKETGPTPSLIQETQGRVRAARRSSNPIPNWALICQAAQARQ